MVSRQTGVPRRPVEGRERPIVQRHDNQGVADGRRRDGVRAQTRGPEWCSVGRSAGSECRPGRQKHGVAGDDGRLHCAGEFRGPDIMSGRGIDRDELTIRGREQQLAGDDRRRVRLALGGPQHPAIVQRARLGGDLAARKDEIRPGERQAQRAIAGKRDGPRGRVRRGGRSLCRQRAQGLAADVDAGAELGNGAGTLVP